MVSGQIKQFMGMRPAQDEVLLPSNCAALARGVWLEHGTLIGLPTQHLLFTCSSLAILAVYRLPLSYSNPTYMYGSSYLQFTDKNTDVLHAPVFGDTFDRYYWANTIDVPRYNTRARIDAGNVAPASGPWMLGIPAPSVAPTCTASGGVGTTVSRAYVYTWVSAYGEEGPPSPALVKSGKVDDTWALTVTAPISTDLGGSGANRNISKVRIYRTVTDSAGVATYYLVVELAVASTTYNDTVADATVTNNTILPSTNWSAPPTDLKGWVLMPNGSIAGFRANEVWFSEPYRPHAWPPSYVQTVEYDVVGLGITAQTLIVCTKGYPVAMFGTTPASMAVSKLAALEPCNSRQSIISSPEGVYYASPNGIVLAAGGVAESVTAKIITKDKWNEFTNYSSILAARFGTEYYALGAPAGSAFYSGAFENNSFLLKDYAGALSGVLINWDREDLVTLAPISATASVQTDPWSGETLIVHDGAVYWLDVAYAVTGFDPYLWRSKKFQMDKPQNLGAMKVFFSVPAGTPALNPVENTNLVQTLNSDQYGLVRVYADGVLVCTHEIRQSGAMMRIPSGFKAEYWQFEFEARVEIKSFQVATTPKELGKQPFYWGGAIS